MNNERQWTKVLAARWELQHHGAVAIVVWSPDEWEEGTADASGEHKVNLGAWLWYVRPVSIDATPRFFNFGKTNSREAALRQAEAALAEATGV